MYRCMGIHFKLQFTCELRKRFEKRENRSELYVTESDNNCKDELMYVLLSIRYQVTFSTAFPERVCVLE